jgi:hypothetical protein
MNVQSGLTPTDIMASASEVLLRGGYSRIVESLANKATVGNTRLFEDPYGVIELAVYETWNELANGWADAQSFLVELISKYVSSNEPKAWDGYLVLLTPSIVPSASAELVTQIRTNINRVRKLVATGDDLTSTIDVERILLPLLPLSTEERATDREGKALDFLPDLLASRQVDIGAVRVLVQAFNEHQPLLEKLSAYWSKK